jgi:hypothetical protein
LSDRSGSWQIGLVDAEGRNARQFAEPKSRWLTVGEARLQLGLDLPDFDMPNLIAVPVDITKPLNGDCQWIPVTQATVADLDANLHMLDVQIGVDQRRRHHIAMLRQRVVAVIGEKSTLTVVEAAALARELQPA